MKYFKIKKKRIIITAILTLMYIVASIILSTLKQTYYFEETFVNNWMLQVISIGDVICDILMVASGLTFISIFGRD